MLVTSQNEHDDNTRGTDIATRIENDSHLLQARGVASSAPDPTHKVHLSSPQHDVYSSNWNTDDSSASACSEKMYVLHTESSRPKRRAAVRAIPNIISQSLNDLQHETDSPVGVVVEMNNDNDE